jgi:hypothetical protein
MSRLPLAAVLAALALAAPAQAKTVQAHSIVAVGDQISCWALLPAAGRGIECTAAFLPDLGELDPYLALSAHGRATEGERGDYPGYPGRPTRLRDGDRWTSKGVRCRLVGAGLTCRNRDGHGFVLRRGAIRRF